MPHLKRPILPVWRLLLISLLALRLPTVRAADLAVTNGEKIAFLGDSITQQGYDTPAGYVRLVMSGLETSGVKAIAIPAGVSGQKSDQMLDRLDRDVLAKKPDWMTLSCGVNDVWHGAKGIALEPYKQNIEAIVVKAQAAGIKVVILTATMIGEDQSNANNQKLIAYNDFLRSLAKEKNCRLADAGAAMQNAVAAAKKTPVTGNLFTVDGVHMNPDGNMLMASTVLKAFGLTDSQVEAAQAVWLDIPSAVTLTGKTSLSVRQYKALSALAAKRKLTVNDLAADEFAKTIDQLLKQSP
jgi:lysophospholipase L1-like esterase